MSWWQRVIHSRPPDQVIGGLDNPYLLRWHLIPKNRFCNLYLHVFLRSDDDRALHDHPWWNCSILLDGEYTEHTIADGGIHHHQIRRAGGWKLRRAKAAHRIELHASTCVSLFLTGPKCREWGFHCLEKGWVHWRDFCDPLDSGKPGRGCSE
ncbi:hypothetical protein ACSSZE_11960 [Acidithiobacillus caldus]